jgi:hypothetical protein
MAMALPINDTIVAAVAQLIDDSKSNGQYRDPTHSDIDFYVNQAGLAAFDPKGQGQTVGKAKRLRAILHEALEKNLSGGPTLIASILSKVKACGGFRDSSPNFVGAEAIANAQAAFDAEGYVLSADGSICPKVLDSLQGAELTAALRAYAERAQKGSQDAALLTGTGKDLLEATAAHVLQTINGTYPAGAHFHPLLGMAFMALNLAVPEIPEQQGESPIKGMERGMFTSAIAVNRLRNKQGTGHGRPFLPSVTADEAKAAIEIMGAVASYLLAKLAAKR